jgi:hypothetical protein
MKTTITDVQDLQQYQKARTFELGQPISVANSTLTFPTVMTVEVDSPFAKPSMTFAEFDEEVIKQQHR